MNHQLRVSKYLATAAALFMSCTAMAQGTATMNDPATTGAGDSPTSTQWSPSLVRDGAYDRVPHRTTPMDWGYLREADVLWKKRVWREIDTRQKQNQQFVYPGDDETGGGYFIEILMDAIKTGKIKAYSVMNDRFTNPLSPLQVQEMVAGTPDTNIVVNPLTQETEVRITQRDFNPELFTRYRVKEDWIFDRNLGRMVVRIIGIAPMRDVMDPNTGEYRTTAPAFWLYFPEMRKVLAQYEVFNPENDVQRLTWLDYLEGRFWDGRIIQVSNGQNSTYQELGLNPMEALYQGQRDLDEIVNKELDMWVN